MNFIVYFINIISYLQLTCVRNNLQYKQLMILNVDFISLKLLIYEKEL
jgi:hypothetical protein